MFNETNAQDYLNDLHAINIPRLFDAKLSGRDRADGIRNAKTQLNRLKVELQHHRDSLRSSNKKKGDAEVKRIIAPYNLLQNLILQLEGEVSKLQDTLSSGKLLPHPFEFGHYIFGVEETGEWFIGDTGDFNGWEEAEQVKQRLEGFKQDAEPVRKQLVDIQSQFAKLKSELSSMQKKLDKQHKRRFIVKRIFFWLLIAAVAGGIGGYLFIVQNEALGAIGIGISAVCVLFIPLSYLRWKRGTAKLASAVREQKTVMRRLQMDGKRAQKLYSPLQFQIISLQAEYKRLRASLVGGKEATMAKA